DVHPADAQDAFGGRIEQEELARRVGDDEAIAQAVEDGLKELELLTGGLRLRRLDRRRGGATQRRRECFSVAWLPARSVSGSVEVGHRFPLWRKWGSPGARERSSLSASLGYSNTPPLLGSLRRRAAATKDSRAERCIDYATSRTGLKGSRVFPGRRQAWD